TRWPRDWSQTCALPIFVEALGVLRDRVDQDRANAADPCRLCRAQDRILQQAATDSLSMVASINGNPRNDHHRNRVRYVASHAPEIGRASCRERVEDGVV